MKALHKFWSRTEQYHIKNHRKFNSGYPSKDRDPNKIKNCIYLVNGLFDRHYFYNDGDFNFDYFMKDLIKHERFLKVLYNYYLKEDKDYRSGVETYGYADEKSIRSNLSYINSKWKCSFRIKWLLDLIEIQKQKETK